MKTFTLADEERVIEESRALDIAENLDLFVKSKVKCDHSKIVVETYQESSSLWIRDCKTCGWREWKDVHGNIIKLEGEGE